MCMENQEVSEDLSNIRMHRTKSARSTLRHAGSAKPSPSRCIGGMQMPAREHGRGCKGYSVGIQSKGHTRSAQGGAHQGCAVWGT